MKKLLSTLLLAAAVPATMLAKPYQADNMSVKAKALPVPVKQAKFLKADTKVNPAILMETLGKAITSNDTIPRTGWAFYSITGTPNDANIMCYEPKTDAVYLVYNTSTAQQANDATSETRGKVNVRIYGNGGKTLSDTIQIYNKKDTIAWSPSIAVQNPTGTTELRKVNIFVSNEETYGVDVAAGMFKNYEVSTFAMYNGSTTSGVPLRKYIFENGPEDSPVYGWRSLKPHGFISKSENVPYYIMGAPLFATPASGQKHGPYGIAVYKNADVQEQLSSQFPQEFGITKFKEPTATSIYNSPVLFGTDNEGTVYGMVNNIFASDKSKRLPGIAKSTDDGITWSDFEIMPWSVFDEYCKKGIEDGTPTDETDFGFVPFDGVDFTVLGKDHFSYIAIALSQSKTTNDLYVYDIVEVYKENGQWGMRKIEDMRTRATDTRRGRNAVGVLYKGTVDAGKDKLVYDDNVRGYELELAVTKDNQYIIAKWIDNVNTIDAEGLKEYNYLDTLENVKVMYLQTKADGSTEWIETDNKGFTPTAIYMKYRKISENTWSETIKLTNDENYHLHTHITDIVPSLHQIPILTSLFRNEIDFTQDPEYFINKVPTKQRGMITSEYRHTIYRLYDAMPASVDNNTTSSKEAVSVFPNPTNGEFTIKFNNATENSTVEIFNTLGEKVMNVVGTTANASALTNGIYLVKVTNNGNVTSTLFTVAK